MVGPVCSGWGTMSNSPKSKPRSLETSWHKLLDRMVATRFVASSADGPSVAFVVVAALMEYLRGTTEVNEVERAVGLCRACVDSLPGDAPVNDTLPGPAWEQLLLGTGEGIAEVLDAPPAWGALIQCRFGKPDPARGTAPAHVGLVAVSSVLVAPHRRKGIDEAVVTRLMESIQRRGLLYPISIRPDGNLVIGLHRLVAHERLRRAHIPAFTTDADPTELELDEIEENLARRDLTLVERVRLEHRQKELYLKRNPDTRQGVAGGKARQGQQPTTLSFAGAAAAENGISKRTIERRLKIGDAMTGEIVALLADHPIANNQAQLLQLAKKPTEQRSPIANVIAEGQARTVDGAARILSRAPQDSSRPKQQKASGRLIKSGDGYEASIGFRGRKVLVTISADLSYVELIDKGSGRPAASPDSTLMVQVNESGSAKRQVRAPQRSAEEQLRSALFAMDFGGTEVSRCLSSLADRFETTPISDLIREALVTLNR